MRKLWENVEWVIIDEILMVSHKMLRQIHLRFQELKNNERPFGGLNVLVFGDLMQLPPVRVSPVFDQPAEYRGEPNLWRLFGFVELTTIMRQQNDSEFVDILNNLRVGSSTQQQLEVLNSRKIEQIDESGEFDETVRVFPTKKQVEEYRYDVSKNV